jgi:hypothetical protein
MHRHLSTSVDTAEEQATLKLLALRCSQNNL